MFMIVQLNLFYICSLPCSMGVLMTLSSMITLKRVSLSVLKCSIPVKFAGLVIFLLSVFLPSSSSSVIGPWCLTSRLRRCVAISSVWRTSSTWYRSLICTHH